MTAPALVQKLWNYCNILRADGLSYSDHVEQLTFLPFLKMADVQGRDGGAYAGTSGSSLTLGTGVVPVAVL